MEPAQWLSLGSLALAIAATALVFTKGGGRAHANPGVEAVYRVVVLGDSNSDPQAATAKFGHPTWLEHLDDLLPNSVEFVNLAESGSRMVDSWESKANEALSHQPNALLVMWGTNDALAGYGSELIQAARNDIEDHAASAGVPAFFIEPPAVHAIGEIDPALAEQANEALCGVNWSGAWACVPTADLWCLEAYTPVDGIHPSGRGHWPLALRVREHFGF